ncbi:MAG TPA: hypothetical protein VK625_10665 [Flavitalea sp.]|nr:hypothetical protein [Flavitalea sp.]
MLQIISWQQYVSYLGLTLLIYYAIFLVLFGRNYLRTINVAGSFETTDPNFKKSKKLFAGNLGAKENRDLLYSVVHDAVNEIQAFLQNLKMPITNEEIIISLNAIVQKYPSLKKGNFRQSINDLIVITCENSCSIKLSADDLREVWDDDGATSIPPPNGKVMEVTI